MHVRIALGAEQYALAIAGVREVRELGDVARVPGAPASVLGVTNVRGEVLPVLALADLLGLAGDVQARRIVVVEDAGRRAGLAVDELVDVAPLAGLPEPAEGPFLEGAVVADGALIGLIDLPGLLDSVQAGSAA